MDGQQSAGSVVFTPENVALINRAYAEAIELVGQPDNQELRAKLAEQMMALARNGEFDERRLCSLSISAVLGHVPDPKSRQVTPHPVSGNR